MLWLEDRILWCLPQRRCGCSWMQHILGLNVLCRTWRQCNLLGGGGRITWLCSCHIWIRGQGSLMGLKWLRCSRGLEGGLDLLGSVEGLACFSTRTGIVFIFPFPIVLWGGGLYTPERQAPFQSTIPCTPLCRIGLAIHWRWCPFSCIALLSHWWYGRGPCMSQVGGGWSFPCRMRPTFPNENFRRL